MSNNNKRLLVAAILGIPAVAVIFFSAQDLIGTYPAAYDKLYDIMFATWFWAQLGLGYRAFETRDKFDSPPWVAYFFSYQIRVIVGVVLISTVAMLLVRMASVSNHVALGISGPLAFVFGREPKLNNLSGILEKLGA